MIRPDALVRTVQAAARNLPPGTLVVPVPLRRYETDPHSELALRAMVAAAYGATHLLAELDAGRAGPAAASRTQVGGTLSGSTLSGSTPSGGTLSGGTGADDATPGPVIPVIAPGDWAYDPAAEVWRPLALIEPGTERTDLAADELESLLDHSAPIPSWFTPPAVAQELRRARPPRSQRGPGHLLYRAVRLGQVHHRPGAARRAE